MYDAGGIRSDKATAAWVDIVLVDLAAVSLGLSTALVILSEYKTPESLCGFSSRSTVPER